MTTPEAAGPTRAVSAQTPLRAGKTPTSNAEAVQRNISRRESIRRMVDKLLRAIEVKIQITNADGGVVVMAGSDLIQPRLIAPHEPNASSS
jgi:hypothetical protein